MTGTSDSDLKMAYVRCRDLDGELWTVPRGSKLHLLLWSDVQQGYPEPFVPVELIRQPWRGLDINPTKLLLKNVTEWVSRSPFVTPSQRNLSAHEVYRVGQFLRLQHRVKVRTSTNV